MGRSFDIKASFWPLFGLYVCAVDKRGRVHKGRIIDVGRADDNDSGEDSIGIVTRPKDREGVDLDRSEIVSIEILDDDEITEDIRLDVY